MKNVLLLVSQFVMCAVSFAQSKIPADSAAKHIGEKVTICTNVYGVKSLDKFTFINMGAANPNSPLTIVIFAKDLANFKSPPAILYNNKKVCVTGKLEGFKYKAEIVITRP